MPHKKNSFVFAAPKNWTVMRTNKADKSFQTLSSGAQKLALEIESTLREKGPYIKDKDLPQQCKLKNTTAPNSKGRVFHANILDKGIWYIIEWEIISKTNQQLVIPNMGSHENYVFKTPFTSDQLKFLGINTSAEKSFNP